MATGRIRSIRRPKIARCRSPLGAYIFVCTRKLYVLGRYLEGERR